MTNPADCSQNTDSLKLVREGTSQHQRQLAALDPAYAPVNERKPAHGMVFAQSYAALLKYFDVTNSRGDFQVADLCRLANDYAVSVQAITLRLESLGLIRKGTWDTLSEQGFKPETAKRNLQLQPRKTHAWKSYPARYELLAVLAFRQGELTEGELATYFRTDRVSARQIVRGFADRFDDVSGDGEDAALRLPLELSVLNAS